MRTNFRSKKCHFSVLLIAEYVLALAELLYIVIICLPTMKGKLGNLKNSYRELYWPERVNIPYEG